MTIVRRAEWGAKPSRYALTRITSTKGVKVHYEGAPTGDLSDHSKCAPHMRALQASHLANKTENYSDIAYNYVVCPHGYAFEGRGAGYKCGANGNSTLNAEHYAVCGMVGTSGQTHPTDAMKSGILEAIAELRAKGGAGSEIKGHKDGYATSCPGPDLYGWVQSGAPAPGGVPTPPVTPPKPAPVPPFPGARAFQLNRSHWAVTQLDYALIRKGYTRHNDGNGYQPGPVFTEYTRRNVADFQRATPALAGDPDGYPGPLTWKLLFS